MAYTTSTILAKKIGLVLDTMRVAGNPVIILQWSKPVAVIMPFDPEKHSGIKLELLELEDVT